MRTHRNSGKLRIIIVGPSAKDMSGSLLRPMNFYYSLKDLKTLSVRYLPISRLAQLFMPKTLSSLLKSDIVIVSGTNPWISAFMVLARKIFRRTTVVDVHGVAWLESISTGQPGIIGRFILFLSEYLTYKHAHYIIAASTYTSEAIYRYFTPRKARVIENALTPIFEDIVAKLKEKTVLGLREKISILLGLQNHLDKTIVVAPLPGVFSSNILAYSELMNIAWLLPSNVLIIVTGHRIKRPSLRAKNEENSRYKVIQVGFLTYPAYAALLLSSEAIILPYPKNAICGGARNKVLEAGYIGKPIVSTPAGMLFIPAIPRKHYIPLEEFLHISKNSSAFREWNSIGLEFQKLILSRYTFKVFKRSLLKELRGILTSASEYFW